MFHTKDRLAPSDPGPVLKTGTFWFGFISCAWIVGALLAFAAVIYGGPSLWPAVRCLQEFRDDARKATPVRAELHAPQALPRRHRLDARITVQRAPLHVAWQQPAPPFTVHTQPLPLGTLSRNILAGCETGPP